MRLQSHIWKFIEGELCDYEDIKKEIAGIRGDVIYAGKVADGMPKGNETSDSTSQKALTLTSNVVLVRMEKTVNAIDKAVDKLTPMHRELFILHYKQGKPWQTVAVEMHDINGIVGVSDRTFFYKKKELIMAIAYELGLYRECS